METSPFGLSELEKDEGKKDLIQPLSRQVIKRSSLVNLKTGIKFGYGLFAEDDFSNGELIAIYKGNNN
jgi:hypothetical protein